MYKRIERADGSVIILVPSKESKSVTFEIMYKVGSRQERKDMNGSTHFIEHLMFKGTKRRPNTKVISRELDSVGAEYNAFTGKDHTAYYVMADMSHLPLAVDIIGDMVHNSKFDPKEVERERGVIIEELNGYRDNPMMHIDEVFESLLFKGSSLGWEIGGPREVIRVVKRDDMVRYMQQHYYPGNMVLGIAGNFSEKKALALIKKHFPVKKSQHKATIKPFRFAITKPRVKIEYKETDQIQMMLGFPGLPYKHKDSEALLLLSVIMGGNMSSRLFINIRERLGLAYDVRTSQESFEDTGYFAVRAGLQKASIFKALEAIKGELVRVSRHGVTREEYKRAKDNIRGRLILRFEKTNALLSYFLSQELLTSSIDNLETTLEKIDRVKIDDINRLARTIISWKKVNLALIGPYKSGAKFLDILKKRVP